MKTIKPNSKLWGAEGLENLKVNESIQGSLRNCYFFAVLASLIDIYGDKYIRAAIPYYNEVIYKNQ